MSGRRVQIFFSISNCSMEVKRFLPLKPPKVSIYLEWINATFVGNKEQIGLPLVLAFQPLWSIDLPRHCTSHRISNICRRENYILPWHKQCCLCSRECGRFWIPAWEDATISNINYLNELATNWNQNNRVTHTAPSHQYVPTL